MCIRDRIGAITSVKPPGLDVDELNTNFNTMRGKVSKLASIKMKDRGIDPHEKANREKQNRANANLKSVKGDQNNQVAEIVNQVLSSLDKDVAGEIRQEISRADNKFQALQAAMKSRGLTEATEQLEYLIRVVLRG